MQDHKANIPSESEDLVSTPADPATDPLDSLGKSTSVAVFTPIIAYRLLQRRIWRFRLKPAAETTHQDQSDALENTVSECENDRRVLHVVIPLMPRILRMYYEEAERECHKHRVRSRRIHLVA